VRQSTPVPALDPVQDVRTRLEQESGLPFLEHLSADRVDSVCRTVNHCWRQRIYTPWITMGMFLSQVISSDQSCADALERFQKYRADNGLPPVSDDTVSYCEARQRLPEELAWELTRGCGQSVHQNADREWLFHGRAVKLAHRRLDRAHAGHRGQPG
jgi:hypothetical protein